MPSPHWTVYLPIVLKDAMPMPQPAATPTPTATLPPTPTSTPTLQTMEHRYSDGSPESSQSWEVGKGFAVYFDQILAGWRFLHARYYLLNPAPIQVHIWDHEGQDMITPFTASPATDGWFDVDLWDYGAFTTGEAFYVGFTHTADYQPDIGVDTTNPRGHSYEVDGAYFELKENLNYMIGVVVAQ